jgi:DNA-binding beta-propeller fold protein YncE
VYFIAGDPNIADDELCYQYYPGTGQLDSFPLPVWPNRHMSVSADGKQIWISTYDTSYVFDLGSKSIISEISLLSGWTGARFSRDNQMAAFSYTELYIIDAHDYSVIFHDISAAMYGRGHFSANNKRYYCSYNGTHVFIVDLSDNFRITRHLFDDLGFIQDIVPSVDERYWFITTDFSMYHSGFYVYDTQADSVIYSQAIGPQPIRIKLSPCGKYIYLTAGGTLNSVDIAQYSFAIFDIETNRFIEEVKITLDDIAWPYMVLDHIVITPDGRYLFGTWMFQDNRLPAYDLLRKDTVEVLHLTKHSGNICCQIGL